MNSSKPLSPSRQARAARLLPGGVPRWVRIYDNGGDTEMGGTFDRFTVCFTGKAGTIRTPRDRRASCQYRAMSCRPFDPQGFGQWGESWDRHCDVNKAGFAPAMGRKCHLGKRIPFAELPEDCRKLVLSDYRELWGI